MSVKVPQTLMALLIGLQMVGAFVLDKKPQEPLHDGANMFASAFIVFILLGWGGFWSKKP